MTYRTIDVEPVSPAIGAHISGVDLGNGVSDEQFDEIHDALMAHKAIFFRDQEMTLDQHKEFGRRFGELHIHPASPAPDGHPEILVVHADENSRVVAGNGWHTDVSCDAEPPMASILHVLEVPDSGGDTMFANMAAAFNALSDPMKEFLSGLTAVHSSNHVYRGRYGYDNGGVDYPESEHPVIRTHPVTGEQCIFVNAGFTTRIKGLKPGESKAVLEYLHQHVQTPEFHIRFHWKPNSVAIWDNRCTQHRSVWDYFPQGRHGYRVTIKGGRPFYQAENTRRAAAE